MKNILAIDIGGSKILTAIVRVEQREHEGQRCNTTSFFGIQKSILERKNDPVPILEMIDRLVPVTLDEARLTWEQIDGFGVTIPGLADPKRGYWVYAPFSGIRDFPIAEILSKKYQKHVFADNDVNACAWAEKMFGVCQNVEDFLWITVSNGIGGGLVLNGNVYPGTFGGAAEFGHINVVEHGNLCGCGNRGCLEATAAGPAIARRGLELLNQHPDQREQFFRDADLACEIASESKGPDGLGNLCRENFTQDSNKTAFDFRQKFVTASLLQNPNDWGVSAASIARAARQENALAVQIYRETGHYLGRAAAMASNLLNPAKIVLGGGVSAAFDLFYPEMERTFREQVLTDVNRSVQIEKTGLGYEAGLLGAASLACGPF